MHKDLAEALDRFAYDVDPYEYNDRCEEENFINEIYSALLAGETSGISDWLNGIIEEESGDSEQIKRAKELLERVKTLESDTRKA